MSADPDVRRPGHAAGVGRSAAGFAFVCLTALACGTEVGGAARREILVASTTSMENSGLLDVLLPAFQAAHPQYRIKLIAVGSGEAMALGRRGDADVLLVHSPAEEAAFMAAGYGRARAPVMANEFVLVGPASDPADVRAARSAAGALRRIAEARAPFVSRGDSSGTHHKELQLWSLAGGRPEDPARTWYMEIGQGMGDALRVANERRAYVLTDRATFLFLDSMLDLEVVYGGAEVMYNPYSVITVAHAWNTAGADEFARWLQSAAARALIAQYGVARFGRALFVPRR